MKNHEQAKDTAKERREEGKIRARKDVEEPRTDKAREGRK